MSAPIGQLAIHLWDNWDIQKFSNTNKKSFTELNKIMQQIADHQTTVLINYLTHRGEFSKKCEALNIITSL